MTLPRIRQFIEDNRLPLCILAALAYGYLTGFVSGDYKGARDAYLDAFNQVRSNEGKTK